MIWEGQSKGGNKSNGPDSRKSPHLFSKSQRDERPNPLTPTITLKINLTFTCFYQSCSKNPLLNQLEQEIL